MEPKFSIGDSAVMISSGQIVTIAKCIATSSGFYYIVKSGKQSKRCKEDLLDFYLDADDTISTAILEGNFESADRFKKYYYYHLFSESQENSVYSYQGNKIIFNPFQYKPLLKFLRPETEERLLIADEVGVGKTIEAGLILDELLARGDLQKDDFVMIVCPNILTQKWREELRTKFLLDDFWIHDGKSLSYMLQTYLETERIAYPHSIVSEQLFRSIRYRDLLTNCLSTTSVPFIQLLIVDECHHYRNETGTHELGELLSSASERVLMLSATPFNLRSSDLYNQFHILNPSLFQNEQLFDTLLQQVRQINECIALLRENTTDSRTKLKKILPNISSFHDNNLHENLNQFQKLIKTDAPLSIDEIVSIEKTLTQLNPIAPSFTRTLKHEAIAHRVTREVITLKVHFTDAEQKLYDDFLETNLHRYQLQGVSERAFGLILNGLERIAASSLVALEKNIHRFTDNLDTEVADTLADDYQLTQADSHVLSSLLSSYQSLQNQIQNLRNHDSKYAVLKELISQIWNSSPDNKRILIFSFYIGTLKYLRKRLCQEGYRVGILYGATPRETTVNQYDEDNFPIISRVDTMENFKVGNYDILLASEVGGEGLDFQFCTALINYDLPYNPMRIEQRIGRIDRMGQLADKIIIGNLCIENTIDETINRVLLTRIEDASSLIGELEPIIPEQMIEINHALITHDFSEVEKKQRALEEATQKALKKLTLQDFDSQKYDLANDSGFRERFEDQIRKSRISPDESMQLTYTFLRSINGCWCKLLGSHSAEIHLTKELRSCIQGYLERIKPGLRGTELKQISNSVANCYITFSGDQAYSDSTFIFIKPCGEWCHFILEYLKVYDDLQNHSVFQCRLKPSNHLFLSHGTYYLFSYHLICDGFHPTVTTEYILFSASSHSILPLSEDTLRKLLITDIENGTKPNISLDDFDDARTQSDFEMDKRCDEHMHMISSKNNLKINARIEALNYLCHTNCERYRSQMVGASDKDQKRLANLILREQEKTANQVKILEDKKRFSATHEFQSVCIISVY